MKIKNTITQAQRILPSQIQFLNFLKLQKEELMQTVAQQLAENPFLEDSHSEEEEGENEDAEILSYEDDDCYEDEFSIKEVGINDRTIHEEKKDVFSNASRSTTTREELIEELRTFKHLQEDFEVACYIINSLDDDGYLRQDIESITDDFSFSRQRIIQPEDVERAIELVQECDPAGIGARNLCECLQLQIFRKVKKSRADVLAYNILDEHFDLLCERRFNELEGIYEVDQAQLQAALKVIKNLKARPVSIDEPTSLQISPSTDIDFVITKDEAGNLVGLLASSFEGRLKISADSEELLNSVSTNRGNKKSPTERNYETFLKTKAKDARWFIDCLMQREQSMKLVIDAIIAMQKDYLISGETGDLKPMILQNLADMTGLDVSTISRITSARCADTPIGKLYLKDLFTKGLQSEDGHSISNANVKEMMAEIISQEDKARPYTDEEISKILGDRGIKIARRTVLKYREQLHIPVAKLRGLRAA
jgi:RNA polymerase sigma-54 factor